MAVDQGASIDSQKEPVNDTIDSAYDVISDTGLGGEIKLTLIRNDGYN